jgi:hypothetical protein
MRNARPIPAHSARSRQRGVRLAAESVIAQGRVIHRAAAVVVSTTAAFVTLAAMMSAPAWLVAYGPGEHHGGPVLPALELGVPSTGSTPTGSVAVGAYAPAAPAPVRSTSPAGTAPATAGGPAPTPQEQRVAAGAAPGAALPDPASVLAAIPVAAEAVQQVIAAPTAAEAPAAPPGELVPNLVPEDRAPASEDHGAAGVIPEEGAGGQPGTDQNSLWLDTEDPTGLVNILLGNGSTP